MTGHPLLLTPTSPQQPSASLERMPQQRALCHPIMSPGYDPSLGHLLTTRPVPRLASDNSKARDAPLCSEVYILQTFTGSEPYLRQHSANGPTLGLLWVPVLQAPCGNQMCPRQHLVSLCLPRRVRAKVWSALPLAGDQTTSAKKPLSEAQFEK